MGLSVPAIYAQGSGGSPNAVVITLRFIDLTNGQPVANQHGTYSTNLGTMSLPAFETDDYGYATVSLTADSRAGMAVVVAMPDNGLWPQIIDVPILYGDEPGQVSGSQGYQLFIQGKQYKFTAGTYSKSF
jgi:hypothetical protein